MYPSGQSCVVNFIIAEEVSTFKINWHLCTTVKDFTTIQGKIMLWESLGTEAVGYCQRWKYLPLRHLYYVTIFFEKNAEKCPKTLELTIRNRFIIYHWTLHYHSTWQRAIKYSKFEWSFLHKQPRYKQLLLYSTKLAAVNCRQALRPQRILLV
jgi:hypothetical protein